MASGQNTSGELGIGTNTNIKNFTKVNTPNIENAKVKYIKAGKTSSAIALTNSKVYTVRNKQIRRTRTWKQYKHISIWGRKN